MIKGETSSNQDSEVKVSIISLAYNHKPYIKKALDGFVSQKTNFVFEVIIHDDASTDGTVDIIREYVQKYPNIFKPIYQSENQYKYGVNLMLKNIIYPKVNGKYIAACEGDDYWTDELKLQKQYDFMEANPDYSLCFHNVVVDNLKTGKKTEYSKKLKQGLIPFEKLVLLPQNPPMVSLFLLKEYYLLPDFLSKSKVGAHSSIIMNCALNGKVYYLDKIMGTYNYFSVGSWSSQKSDAGSVLEYTIVIEYLYEVDRLTRYKYTAYIHKRICRFKRLIFSLTDKFSLVVNEKYNGTNRKLAVSETIRLFNVLFVKRPLKKIVKSTIKFTQSFFKN